MLKGYHCVKKGVEKGYGVGPWGGASLYKTLLSTPHSPTPGGEPEKEIGAKPFLNPSPITVALCFVPI